MRVIIPILLIFGFIAYPLTAAENASTPRAEAGESIDLLKRYPTKLTASDTTPEHAREWAFTTADIFQVSHFAFETGKELRVETGTADVGIGHCGDGAVWAVIIPRESGTLIRQSTNQESIAHVWLRFHPAEISRLFPSNTVRGDGDTNLFSQMRRIANHKFMSSWHAGNGATIPEPKDMTVDVDTKDGLRRFFSVDTEAGTAQYWPPFQEKALRPIPAVTAEAAQAAFDQLWEAFDRNYAMFTLRPEVDWTKLRETYRPRAIGSKSVPEFAEVCAEMLKTLRDLHVWLTLSGEYVPVFNRPRSANSNPSAHENILGSLHEEGRRVQWAVTKDKIGFIAIYGWDDPDVPAQCQRALEKMRDTRGLIVDVRLNGGGSEDLAMEFAGRFLKSEFTYAYSQFRNGPSHTNLTEKFPRKITPHGPWRYDRPVMLLIGQKGMSSNESFVGMMTGDPDVTTMGDHTCGSSGNPQIIELPLEMTVSVPQWIDYRPDGTSLDERGFQPQILFTPKPGAFEGDRDDLLTAALERLQHAPLPDKPIIGAVYMSAEEIEARDESRPKVVSVFPADGAQSVEPVTELRVKFDRPMDPLSLKLDWKSGGMVNCGFPSYNPEKKEFTIPVNLCRGMIQELVVNEPMGELGQARTSFPHDGFQSTDHRLARLFSWKFKTSGLPDAKGEPPKVVRVSPSPGSSVPYRTWVEIQFDQAMKSTDEALPYLLAQQSLKKPALICRIEYDATNHTFRLPLLLLPKEKSTLTLDGFYSETGVKSKPVEVNYQISDEALSSADRERFESGGKDSQLLETINLVRRERTNMTSLAERVQSIILSRQKDFFTTLQGNGASFKWQKPNRFYADATSMMPMCTTFVVGSDGENWWWHTALPGNTTLESCPAKEFQQLNISICDPFDLTHNDTTQSVAGLELMYAGTTNILGAKCHSVQGWSLEDPVPGITPMGSAMQWWIDAQTGRSLGTITHGDNYIQLTRFFYDSVNHPLPPSDFEIPKIENLSPSTTEPMGEGYTNRFITISDGSDGSVRLRYGKIGPKGRYSSGLN